MNTYRTQSSEESESLTARPARAGGEILHGSHEARGEARGVRGDAAIRHGQPATQEAGSANCCRAWVPMPL
jgi:hypothetical protein